MKLAVIPLVALLLSCQLQAENECGLTVARHIGTANTDALTELLVTINADTNLQLIRLVDSTGELTSLVKTSAPRFETFIRRTVTTGDLANVSKSSQQLVNATSEKLGEVQIEVHSKIGSTCAVLAIYINSKT